MIDAVDDGEKERTYDGLPDHYILFHPLTLEISQS